MTACAYPIELQVSSSDTVGHQYTVTGVPGQPVAVIAMCSGRTSTSAQQGTQKKFSFGAATGPTQRWSNSSTDVDQVPTVDVTQYRGMLRNDAVVTIISGSGGTVLGQLDLINFTSDGAVFEIDVAFDANYVIDFFFIYGSGIEIIAGSGTVPAATGRFDISLPFKPTGGILTCGSDIQTGFNASSSTPGQVIGWTDFSAQGCVGFRTRDGQTIVTALSWINTTNVLATNSAATATYITTIAPTAAYYGGAAFNRAAGTNAMAYTYLLFKGLSCKVGTFPAQTSTGLFDAASGLAFTPSAVLCASRPASTASITTAVAPAEVMLGWGADVSGVMEQVASWLHTFNVAGTLDDVTNPTWTETARTPDVLLEDWDKHATVHGTPSMVGQLVLASFPANKISINQVDASPVASLVNYMALDGAAASQLVPNYYRSTYGFQ